MSTRGVRSTRGRAHKSREVRGQTSCGEPDHPDSLPPPGLDMTKCHIQILPFDILHHIFLYLYQSASESNSVQVSISHVCRTWREYALSIPTLWSSLLFSGIARRQAWEKQLKFLERSGDAPLDIKIFCGQNRHRILPVSAIASILRILVPHVHRWRSLHIHLHIKGMRVIAGRLHRASAPLLERLILEIWSEGGRSSGWKCCMFAAGLPSLRYWKTPARLLPPSSATHRSEMLQELLTEEYQWNVLLLHPPSADDIVSILSKSLKLRKLVLQLDYWEDPQSRAAPLAEQVLLSHLESLELGTSTFRRPITNTHVQIFSQVRAPSISSIDGSILHNNVIPMIATFNPFPGLKKLHLQCDLWNGDDVEILSEPHMLRNALAHLDSLEDLAFEDQWMPDHAFDTLKKHCPRLIHIAFLGCMFESSECVEMVKARKHSAAVTSLLRVQILNEPSWRLHDQDCLWLALNVPQFDSGYLP